MKKEYNIKKDKQLGMALGTANYRLHRMILFHLVQTCGVDYCFQCGRRIKSLDQLSVEHKVPWLDSEDPQGLFFGLDNIAFSHRKCNIAAKRHRPAKTKTLVCANCGEEFEKKSCQIKGKRKERNQENFYCSQECAGNKKKE